MPDVLVLDASALCKLVRNEPESMLVDAKIMRHLEEGGAVWTDAFAALELVTCARKALDDGEGTLEDLSRAVQDALAVATLVRRDGDDGHELAALLELARDTGLSGPDARYLELARGNRLLTFDAKQARAAKAKGIALA